MKFKIKYIVLTLGLLSVIISFLFFGRHQEVYQLLNIGGLLVSLILFLTILFSKASVKSKLIWTLVVVIAVTVQWLTEPLLIKSSYLIYLKSNDRELTAVNNILKDKLGDVSILNDDFTDQNGGLTQKEKDTLIQLRKKLNVYFITKTETGIYYGLWGFLDVRLGITYWTKNEIPNNSYQPLKDNWYY